MMQLIHTRPSDKQKYLKIPAVIFISFIFSNTVLFGKIAPFSAAFAGSLFGLDSVCAFAGAAIGFMINGSLVNALPNIAAIMIITLFRIIAARNRDNLINVSSAVLSAVSVLSANIFLSEKPSDILVSVFFGLITAVSSYSFIISFKLLNSARQFTLLKPANIAAFGISYAVVTAALTSYDISVFNVGIVCATLVSLSASQKYKYAGGSITGIVAALGIGLANPYYAAGALIVAVSSLGCSLFTRLGKITQAAGFILFSGICIVVFGISHYTLSTMASVFIGTVLFILLPTNKILAQIKHAPKPKSGADISQIFSERLKLSASAMNEVRQAVEKTAEILDRKNSKDISWVYNTACTHVCRKCRFNMKCWGEEYSETVKIFGRLMTKLRRGENIITSDFNGQLFDRCTKKDLLASCINAQYKEYVSSNIANRKVAEMRTILTAQLSATENMIEQMAHEFSESSKFDRSLAARVENLLTSLGAQEVKAAVFLNEGRSSVEAYGKGLLSENAEGLCDKMSAALKMEFDLPEFEYNGKEFRITLYERALFSIEYGVSQHNRGNEKNCGDYYDTFIDSKGYAYIILSDGMGSGGRARIDSAFACGMLVKLLRSNINLSSAIEIINNSLLVKSTDESFATLDICRIDLYSGQVELYKAGAAPTYIRCNKKLIKASGRGMPIGIDSKVSYERQCFNIGNSDVIIMTSDGAELNEKWLEHELELNHNKSDDMENIAQLIAGSVKRSGTSGKGDDISVIAVKLVK